MKLTLLLAALIMTTPVLLALGTLQSASYIFSENDSTVIIQLPDTQKGLLVYHVNGRRTEMHPTGAGGLTIKYTDAPWVRFERIDDLDYLSITVAMSSPAFRQQNEGFSMATEGHYKILDFGLGLRMTMITKVVAGRNTTSEIKIFPSEKTFDSFSEAFDEIALQKKALLHQNALARKLEEAKPALPDPFKLPNEKDRSEDVRP